MSPGSATLSPPQATTCGSLPSPMFFIFLPTPIFSPFSPNAEPGPRLDKMNRNVTFLAVIGFVCASCNSVAEFLS